MPNDLDWSKRIVLAPKRHVDGCECKGCRKKRRARMPDPTLLTVRETQRLISDAALSVEPVREWPSLPVPPIECVRFGNMVRYRRTDVARYINALKAFES